MRMQYNNLFDSIFVLTIVYFINNVYDVNILLKGLHFFQLNLSTIHKHIKRIYIVIVNVVNA